MGKAFHVGHGVRSGIFAALLAQEDFSVDPDIIEGAERGGGEGHQRFGLADTFSGIGKYRLHLMVDGLGDELEVARNTTHGAHASGLDRAELDGRRRDCAGAGTFNRAFRCTWSSSRN